MRFLFRWIIRLFGLFVFVRGSWALWPILRGDHLQSLPHMDGHDAYLLVEHITLSSAFLLALSGLIILVLSMRR